MKLIAIITIGVLVLAGIGAAATAVTTQTATQPSQPSVFTFNIPATAAHGAGTLVIDLAEHKFVFDGTGEPSVTYYLQYTLKNQSGIHQFGSAIASPSGTLHTEGNWTKPFGSWATKQANTHSTRALGFAGATPSDNETLTAEPTFLLSTTDVSGSSGSNMRPPATFATNPVNAVTSPPHPVFSLVVTTNSSAAPPTYILQVPPFTYTGGAHNGHLSYVWVCPGQQSGLEVNIQQIERPDGSFEIPQQTVYGTWPTMALGDDIYCPTVSLTL